jgi:polysaccharide biosynthesis transport protein
MKMKGHAGRSPGATDKPARVLVTNLGWIVLVTLVVVAAAAVVVHAQKRVYQAEADVLVQARVQTGVAPQPPDMGTQKAVAASGAVVAIAAQSLDISPHQLANGLSVSVPVDADILQIKYSATHPGQALLRAQSLANAYVTYTTSQATTKSNAPGAKIITDATMPLSPASPRPLIDLGVALIIGLALGVGVALVRDRLDDRVRDRRDFEARVGAPLLAVVPAYRQTSAGRGASLVTLRSPASAAAKAYRDLRTRSLVLAAQRGKKVLLVTGPAGGRHAAAAANLAVAIGAAGQRAILVDGDLQSGRLHELFGMESQSGLGDVVKGTVGLWEAVRQTSAPGLQFLPAGPSLSDPGAVLQRAAFRSVLGQLAAAADIVVIVGPAVLGGAEAGVFAELADMILVVADAKRSTRAQVGAAMHELDHVRPKLIGCVFVNVGVARRLPGGAEPPTGDQQESPDSAQGKRVAVPGVLRVRAHGRAPGTPQSADLFPTQVHDDGEDGGS